MNSSVSVNNISTGRLFRRKIKPTPKMRSYRYMEFQNKPRIIQLDEENPNVVKKFFDDIINQWQWYKKLQILSKKFK